MQHRFGLQRNRSRYVVIVSAVLVVIGVILLSAVSVSAAEITAVQDNNPEIAVMPGNLERLSWGAVLAGAILALMLQLGLNLLGIGLGITSITPNPDDPDDDGSPKAFLSLAVVWIGFSTLVALFTGGWVAARFAGIPSDTDGMLHGLMVWGLVMIVTLLLISTTIGRVVSGISTLIGQGLSIAGRAAGAVAQGAAGAAGAVVQGVGNVAGGAASTAASAVRDAAQRAQPAVENAAQNVRGQVDQVVQGELDKHPEMRQALDRQNLSRQGIEEEARKLLSQAGVQTDQVQGDVQQAANESVQDVKQAAQTAVGQVRNDPGAAATTMIEALQRVLDKGVNTVQGAVSDVDQDSIVNVLAERTGVSKEEAQQTLRQWQERFNQARTETERVRDQVGSQLQQARTQAESQVKEIRATVGQKVEDVKDDVSHKAKEAAAATTKAVSRIALAAFAAMLIGAIAAGIGGAIGSPEDIPTAEVNLDDTTSY